MLRLYTHELSSFTKYGLHEKDSILLNYPVLKHLTVEGYGLYLGEMKDNRLEIEFDAGPKLILGINGLGKSTLVAMIYRLMIGPFDLPKDNITASSTEDLRQRKKFPSFGNRVADNAIDAQATLKFSIGTKQFVVTRSLADLKLIKTKIGKQNLDRLNDESNYQSEVSNAMGVDSFIQVIQICRNLMFFMEERRELVWRHDAQRHLLSSLFLDSKIDKKINELMDQIGSADSLARNVRYTFNKLRREQIDAADKVENIEDTIGELKALRSAQEAAESLLEEYRQQLDDADLSREESRTNYMRAKLVLDESLRNHERMKLREIQSRFPTLSDSAKYILTHLMSEGECLACNQPASEYASELGRRIETKNCIVCGNDLPSISDSETIEDLNHYSLEAALSDLERSQKSLRASQAKMDASNEMYEKSLEALEELNAEITKRAGTIRKLEHLLPPSERELNEKEKEIQLYRKRMKSYTEARKSSEQKLKKELAKFEKRISEVSDKISKRFAEFSKAFLIEECSLSFEMYRARVGQEGELLEWPSFTVAMTGAAVAGQSIRSGPDAVSESQREFVDLAFRMALLDVSSSGGASTIIIDAPESSLDAVFAPRAGTLLSKFAQGGKKPGNRLILTSNLTRSGLLPPILKPFRSGVARQSRIVDLLELAAPTAALAQYGDEYRQVRDEVLGRKSSS